MRFALTLLATLLMQSPHTKAKPPKPSDNVKQADTDRKGTQDNPLVVHIKGSEPSDQEAAENSEKTAYDEAIKTRELRLTLFIAFAAGVQAIAAVAQWRVYKTQSKIMRKTLKAIRVQANTMNAQTTILSESVAVAKQSAQTTADSLNAMIDKERARLSIEIGKLNFGPNPSVYYRITCHGTTPAYMVSSWQLTGLYPIPDFGWPKEAFGFELNDLPSVIPVGVFEGYNFIMSTNRKPGSFARIDWGDIENKISSGESYLHFRVRVLYRDIFDDVRTHELQISKIYGVKLQDQPQTLFDKLYGKPTKVLGTFPEWSDSAFKFGQVEEEQG
ncbi:hypothetical protein RBB77_08970 [Tunturibacter psychrotolerans]|uniref:Uncharacterized protein n=1 Tax=Tunturiibacter psychrotolerans TaxID=3069686 RepID=A0AAU7ZVP8_9BACT